MVPKQLAPILVLASLAVATPALAQPTVGAGLDQQVTFPDPAQLDGDVQGISSTSFWIADGDGPTEDYVVTYDGVAGLGTIGPLRRAGGIPYGWPSDLIRIGSTVYGVDTFHEQIYTLNEATGIVTPISPKAGGSGWDTRLGSLAYDPATQFLFSVDWADTKDNELYRFDLNQLQWTNLEKLSFDDVRGLAWDPMDELLYLYDADSGEIHTIESDGSSEQFVVAPVHAPGDFYDEITFFRGELYGSLHIDQSGTDVIQVRRIDLVTGAVEDIGPPVVQSDGHSLMIESLPETVEWTVDSGPGIVIFDDPTDPGTSAAFSVAGLYVLRLTVGADPPISDTVSITVAWACSDGIDNDMDGYTDEFDPGCEDPSDDSESDQTGAYPCDDGVSNEGGVEIDIVGGTAILTDDNAIDLADPGCGGDPFTPAPAAGQGGGEYPQCQDGVDNDADGRIDFDQGTSVFGSPQSALSDAHCASFIDNKEKRVSRCGLGFELALLLPPFATLRARRRRARPAG